MLVVLMHMLAGSLEFRLIDLCSELNIQEYPRSAHSLSFPNPQDKSADFSSSSSVGQRNRFFAKMVMGLYEVQLMQLFW